MKKVTAIALVVALVILINVIGGLVYFSIQNRPVYVKSVDMKENMIPTENLIFLKSSYAKIENVEGDSIIVTWSAYLSKAEGNEPDHILFFFNANITAKNYLFPMGEDPMFTVIITPITNHTKFDKFYPESVIVKNHLKYGVRSLTFQVFALWGCSDAYIKKVSNAQAAVSIPVYNHQVYGVSYQLTTYILKSDGSVGRLTLNFNAEASASTN